MSFILENDQTHPQQAPYRAAARFCTRCGAAAHHDARFCAGCGSPLLSGPPDNAAPEQVAPAATSLPDRRAPLLVIAVAVAAVLALLAAGIWAFRTKPEDVVLTTATEQTAALLSDLDQARSTADLRAAGASAAEAQAPLAAILPTLDQGRAVAQSLAALDAILTEVASLADIDGESLADWKPAARGITAAALRLPTQDPVLAGVAAGAETAVESVDRMVKRAERQLARWEAEVTRIEDLNRANAASIERVSSYRAGVEGNLRTYNSLRTETSDFVDFVESPESYVTWAMAFDAMSSGADARRSVRDGLTMMDVPSELSDVHGRLVRMVDDAIAAMDAAYSGLSEANQCYYECYYAQTPGWQQFRAESARITSEFANAQSDWQSRVEGYAASLRPVDVPQRPEI